MKNLENFGVQELNASEIRNTDGGIIGFILSGMVMGYYMEKYKETGLIGPFNIKL